MTLTLVAVAQVLLQRTVTCTLSRLSSQNHLLGLKTLQWRQQVLWDTLSLVGFLANTRGQRVDVKRELLASVVTSASGPLG
jgi:hypothetical protein